MNANNPFPKAAPDFSDPIGLLRACHENIFQHCDMVERLAEHLATQGYDQEARRAADKIHRYFSTAAKHHHADEEEDLFPLLSRQSQELVGVVDQLEQEHKELDALWTELAPLMTQPEHIDDVASLKTLAQRFATANRAHARKENEQLLDIAQHLFNSDALKRLGRRMAERRGVTLPTDF